MTGHVPWWGRPEGPRPLTQRDPVVMYGPANPVWAAGWEAGNQWGEHHPNDQAWLNGWYAGVEEAMDKRFPGWRTPENDDEEEP